MPGLPAECGAVRDLDITKKEHLIICSREITEWLDELDKTGAASSATGYFLFLLERLNESGLWPD
jgi:hypothetical protein